MFSKCSIPRAYFTSSVIVLSALLLFSGVYDIFQQRRRLQNRLAAFQKNAIERRKHHLRSSHQNVLHFLDCRRFSAGLEVPQNRINHLQSEALECVRRMQGVNGAVLFILQADGRVLLDPRPARPAAASGEDPVVRQLLAAARSPSENYCRFSPNDADLGGESLRLAFAKPYADWQWVVGTAVGLDAMEQELKRESAAGRRQIGSRMFFWGVLLLLFVLLSALISKFFSKKVQHTMDHFDAFFARDAGNSESIDERALYFREFQKMGAQVNRMAAHWQAIHKCEDEAHQWNLAARKQAEKALYHSQERFCQLADLLPETIFEADLQGCLTFVNQQAVDQFQYTAAEFEDGLTILDLIDPQDRSRLLDGTGSLLTGRQLRLQECLAVRKDGSSFSAVLNASPIWKHGRQEGFRGFVIDVSEQKRLEMQILQVQKMEAIGTLAGGIAHDFNNILTPIMLHSEIAMMDLPDEHPVLRNLEEIFKSSQRARDLVQQILTFSRQGDQVRKPLKVSLVVKEALKLLRSSLPTTIEIQTAIETREDVVLASPAEIHQVLMNLCTNAANSMRRKGGVLSVTLSEEIPDAVRSDPGVQALPAGGYLRLTVADTGEGVDPAVSQRIFEPYFTTREKSEASGMGLAVVHGIVARNGGVIVLENEPGQGARFHLFFLKSGKDIFEVIQPLDQIPHGSESILLVDDEQTMIDAVQPMLERLGYRVSAFTSSAAAWVAFEAKPDDYDVVITDMTMPEMTGDQLSKRILQLRPEMPVVLCTGFSEVLDEKKAQEIGIRAFLLKPIVMNQMAETIREVLA